MTGVGDGEGDGDGDGEGEGLDEAGASFCEATGRVNSDDNKQTIKNRRHTAATEPEGLAINSHDRKVVDRFLNIPKARRAGTCFCRTFGALRSYVTRPRPVGRGY